MKPGKVRERTGGPWAELQPSEQPGPEQTGAGTPHPPAAGSVPFAAAGTCPSGSCPHTLERTHLCPLTASERVCTCCVCTCACTRDRLVVGACGSVGSVVPGSRS